VKNRADISKDLAEHYGSFSNPEYNRLIAEDAAKVMWLYAEFGGTNREVLTHYVTNSIWYYYPGGGTAKNAALKILEGFEE